VNINARFTETITIKRQTSQSAAGDPVRGTTITAKARIERDRSEVQLGSGRFLNNVQTLYCDTELLLGDQVFFPEDDTSNANASKTVIHVQRGVSLDGQVPFYAGYC
jgi:hypothetical protein